MGRPLEIDLLGCDLLAPERQLAEAKPGLDGVAAEEQRLERFRMMLHKLLELVMDLQCLGLHTLQVLLPVDGVFLKKGVERVLIDLQTAHVVLHILCKKSVLVQVTMDVRSDLLFQIVEDQMDPLHIGVDICFELLESYDPRLGFLNDFSGQTRAFLEH